MEDARKHSRSLIITLLDLKNAFGEVHHDLIRSSLRYHHVPDSFITLFNDIYSNATTSVAFNKKQTHDMKVNQGVLQGDPCSPLLFNICFNTLMKTLDQPRFKNLGFIWGPKSSMFEQSWLQYADDAVIISNNVHDTKLLLQIFNSWCHWSRMIIRLDKCCTFGMRKFDGLYQQFEPAIYLDNHIIPQIAIDESFVYLGKLFNFKMDNSLAKEKLFTKLKFLLKTTSDLKIRAQLKIKILLRYIHSQIINDLKLYDIKSTWIRQNFDKECYMYIRNWLKMPISASIKDLSSISTAKCGLGIPSFADLHEKLWLKKRYKMKFGAQPEFEAIWSETKDHHVGLDSIITHNMSMNSACRNLKSVQDKSTDDHFAKLLVQSALSRTVNENISKTNIILWNNFLQSIPQFLFQFARKALLQLLPTSSNLVRWKRLENPICSLCKLKPQTNLHVLSNCGSDIALERYKFRHNAILRLLFEWLQTVINDTYTVCVDLDTVPQNCRISEILYENVRPDLLLFNNSKIIILELTVCHESNLQKSKIYKQNKYADIKNFLQPKFRKHSVRLFTFEISVLGFISPLTNFCSILSIPELPKSVKSNLINSVLNSTYGIYCKRNTN